MNQPYGNAGPQGAPYGAYDQTQIELKRLKEQSMIWLVVAIVGFWFGAGIITGPLSWVFGSRLRSQYRSIGHQPSGAATGAWLIGMITSLMMFLAMIVLVGMFMFVGGIAMMGAAG